MSVNRNGPFLDARGLKMFPEPEDLRRSPHASSEQFFIGLKDLGTETVSVRYPREGHGLSEFKHLIDSIGRSLAWYEKHFPKPGAEGISNVQP